MTDMTVPVWFYFATLFFVMLWASYLCGKRLAKIISLADAMAEERDALEAKLAKAVEGLYAVVQHEASTFFGPDGEKNKRASWRGVMRKVRTTLAEIKGESHE